MKTCLTFQRHHVTFSFEEQIEKMEIYARKRCSHMRIMGAGVSAINWSQSSVLRENSAFATGAQCLILANPFWSE